MPNRWNSSKVQLNKDLSSCIRDGDLRSRSNPRLFYGKKTVDRVQYRVFDGRKFAFVYPEDLLNTIEVDGRSVGREGRSGRFNQSVFQFGPLLCNEGNRGIVVKPMRRSKEDAFPIHR